MLDGHVTLELLHSVTIALRTHGKFALGINMRICKCPNVATIIQLSDKVCYHYTPNIRSTGVINTHKSSYLCFLCDTSSIYSFISFVIRFEFAFFVFHFETPIQYENYMHKNVPCSVMHVHVMAL
jgi:hypothetical protein